MGDHPRIDRFAGLRDAFKFATGKVLMSYVVIGVASDGEVYSGSKCDQPSDVRALRVELRKALKFCDDIERAASSGDPVNRPLAPLEES